MSPAQQAFDLGKFLSIYDITCLRVWHTQSLASLLCQYARSHFVYHSWGSSADPHAAWGGHKSSLNHAIEFTLPMVPIVGGLADHKA